jgi:hypothetical protein
MWCNKKNVFRVYSCDERRISWMCPVMLMCGDGTFFCGGCGCVHPQDTHPSRSEYVGSHNWDSKPVWLSEDLDVTVSLLERLRQVGIWRTRVVRVVSNFLSQIFSGYSQLFSGYSLEGFLSRRRFLKSSGDEKRPPKMFVVQCEWTEFKSFWLFSYFWRNARYIASRYALTRGDTRRQLRERGNCGNLIAIWFGEK